MSYSKFVQMCKAFEKLIGDLLDDSYTFLQLLYYLFLIGDLGQLLATTCIVST